MDINKIMNGIRELLLVLGIAIGTVLQTLSEKCYFKLKKGSIDRSL